MTVCDEPGCGKPHFVNGRCMECEFAWRYVMDLPFRQRHHELERQWRKQIMAEELAAS
jgi:hypothetical protein